MNRILVAAFIIVACNVVFGQTKEEIQSSNERIEKIQKLEMPKSTSVASIDELNVTLGNAALESASITPLLKGLYYRSVGESADGIVDVTVKKPTLEECKELAARILTQVKVVQGISSLLPSVASDAKEIKNPLKLAKVASSLSYVKTAVSVLGEETMFQSKAINTIIQTLTSSGNL